MPSRPDRKVSAARTGGGHPRRVGVLLPWANVAIEEELPLLAPDGVVFHYARLVPASRTTAIDHRFWDGLRAAATDAADSLRHIPLDALLLGCTSAGFIESTTPVPAGTVTAFDALMAELDRIGAHRIVLATPYPDAVTGTEIKALSRRSITVLASASLGLTDGYPGVDPLRAKTLVLGLPQRALAQADAVVLSCTGWRTQPVLAELAQQLGRPVISSVLAMANYAAHLQQGATP
ncbi:aspartate/glutamate racemase family protein [Streptomyces sp. NPDC097981]|uniref:maleate cis-trans isomerase family protein n=1 Tax=Streptomyces sp. NPDC097981 TaxID=3155428 RepID=UPI00331A49A1